MGQACLQAPLLAHALLHHPRAWPRQETALGLLVSLRKFYQVFGVCHLLAGPAGALAAASPLPWVAPSSCAVCICPETKFTDTCPELSLCQLPVSLLRSAVQIKQAVGNDSVTSAALPMALLTAIVRKEALLPVHTAAFAAIQLLPVIHAAVQRHMAATPGNPAHPDLCRELLVSADITPIDALQAGSMHLHDTQSE